MGSFGAHVPRPSPRTVEARYERLREQGGARLDEPTREAKRLAADEDVQLRLAIFRALGDPNRLLIAELLRIHGPLATTELEMALGLTSGTMSHHLRALETARVVVPEDVGGWRFWRLAAYPAIEAIVPR